MSLYISPNSSFEGDTATVPAAAAVPTAVQVSNAKPQLNETLMDITHPHPSRIPPGTFTDYGRSPVNSRRFLAPAPFFSNAKAASMLERGWMRSLTLVKGQRGLLTIKDGPEMQIEVIEGEHLVPEFKNGVHTVKEVGSSETFDLPLISKDEEWEFYIATNPVPFTPRRQNLPQEWIESSYLRMKKGVKGLIKEKNSPAIEVEIIENFHRIDVKDASGNLIKDTVCTVRYKDEQEREKIRNFSMSKNFTGEWDFYIRNPLRKGGSKKRKVKKGKKTRRVRRKA